MEKKDEILKNWLLSIPLCDKEHVFNRIYEECLINAHTLKNWRYGKCRIPLSGMRDLNKVSLEYSGFEIFEINPSECVVSEA
ncbi:MAG: hypothetical protein HDS97_06195 [Bacteroidales bacterium]|nr:hypothetical protein [Bacteroidales bacterium]